MNLLIQLVYVLGFLQGLIISTIILFKIRGVAFKFLGFLILLLAFGCLFDDNLNIIQSTFIYLSWNANQFLYGPLLFLFTKYSTGDQFKFHKIDLLHFTPFVLFKGLVILEYITGILSDAGAPLYLSYLLIIYSLGYTIYSVYIAATSRSRKKVKLFLVSLSGICLSLWLFSLLSQFNIDTSVSINIYSLVYLGAVGSIYFISYKIFSQPEIFKLRTQEKSFLSDGPNMLTIKDRRQVHFLDTKNILWIEAQDNYVRIHAADQDILYRATLSSIEKKLGTVRFQRIHRSHIVNISQISRINFSPKSTSTLKLRSGEELNIGKKYLAKVKEILKNGLEKF